MGPLFLRRISRGFSLALAVSVAAGFFVNMPLTHAQSSSPTYFIEDAGHSLGGAFLDFWVANEGLTQLGLPVSEPVSEATGFRQFFEYGVLDDKGDDVDVTLSQAGLELLALRHDPTLLAAGKRAGAQREAGAFAGNGDATAMIVTPHVTTTVERDWAGKLASEYENEGGKARFGAPVSEIHFAMGKVVEWFVDGRIEIWKGVGAEAAAAPVGKELALLTGVDTAEIAAGDLLSISAYALATGGSEAAGDVGSSDNGFANATVGFVPTRIEIPAIGVDAYIEQVGIYGGVMGTPAGPMNVGWYPDYGSPGSGSGVIMAGHVDYYTIGPAVFYSLSSLGAGSQIYVTGPSGEGATYAVTGSAVVGADASAESVFGGGGDSLTLITCGGSFNGVAYDSRTIVYAVRV